MDAPEKSDGKSASDENELPGNEGEIQRPEAVDITFRGSPVDKVEAMPRFLRVLYGNQKVSTNGPKNARKSWTCTGFEDKVLMDKYPICPEGGKVKRVHDFAGCWDGRNTDSANHRDHIVGGHGPAGGVRELRPRVRGVTVVQANFQSGVDELRATEDVRRLFDRLTVARYAGLDFPTHCEIPVAGIAGAVEELPATGQRPALVPWQRVR